MKHFSKDIGIISIIRKHLPEKSKKSLNRKRSIEEYLLNQARKNKDVD